MQQETERSSVTSIRRHLYAAVINDNPIHVEAACESCQGQQPYFSVTVSGRDFGGCNHDLALRLFPQLKPVVDLHLSTDDGVPMHAVANAVHWISGILTDLPGFRSRPNSGKHDYGRQTPEWCTQVLGEHLRMDPAPVVERVHEAVRPWLATYSEYEADPRFIEKIVHDTVTQVVNEQRNRWRAEAQHALRIIANLPGNT